MLSTILFRSCSLQGSLRAHLPDTTSWCLSLSQERDTGVLLVAGALSKKTLHGTRVCVVYKLRCKRYPGFHCFDSLALIKVGKALPRVPLQRASSAQILVDDAVLWEVLRPLIVVVLFVVRSCFWSETPPINLSTTIENFRRAALAYLICICPAK
jgi:hypothetical protein